MADDDDDDKDEETPQTQQSDDNEKNRLAQALHGLVSVQCLSETLLVNDFHKASTSASLNNPLCQHASCV